MSCAAAVLVVLAVLIVAHSATSSESETSEMHAARAAVAAMRSSSYLPTPCEKAFRVFWKAFEASGRQGVLYDGADPKSGHILGYGNLNAHPLMLEAQIICARETGQRGDLVVKVLRDDVVAKRRRQRSRQHAWPNLH